MKISRSIDKIKGSSQRWMPMDTSFKANGKKKPIVIFSHGFKGFKDWGAWGLMADAFAEKDFFFVKFNFSHNGGTIEEPIDFPDLKAFSENNYSKEFFDLKQVIDFVAEESFHPNETLKTEIYLIGHSRGGGISVLAAQDTRIKKLATLASIADISARFGDESLLKLWKQKDYIPIPNARTGQEMRINYSIYEDFVENQESLNIQKAAASINIPFLIFHAKDDLTVSVKNAERLKEWSNASELRILESGAHTFGNKHPWKDNALPKELEFICKEIISFFKIE